MQDVSPISEDAMVAAFLRAEIASPRFGAGILAVLGRDGRDRVIVDRPNPHDEAENVYRRQLLGETRGFGREAADTVFTGFPRDVAWHRAALDNHELATLRYIAYDYWIELSGGTRCLADGARHIREGVTAFGVPNDGFWAVADAMCAGTTFPAPIVVGKNAQSSLVILEGHVRLTAYLLRPESLPPQVPVIVGYSARMGQWPLYQVNTSGNLSRSMESAAHGNESPGV